jgi:uncharacterized protein YlxW (UPF0749 family)
VIAQLLMEVTDSTFVAPGISLATFAGLLALAAKSYKEARQIDVEGEKNRRIAAEAREHEAGKNTEQKMTELSNRVRSLETKIDELRESNEQKIEQLRVDHERELLGERMKSYKLRTMLTDHGVDIPEELGPS